MSSMAEEGVDASSGDPPQEEAVPVNISKESANWSTAFQNDSILANFDADSLLLILSQLSLSEVYKVGLTCRRLFFFFKQSCRPRHKSLVLLKGKWNDLEKYKAGFEKMIEKESEVTSEQQVDPLLIEIVLTCDSPQPPDLMPSTVTRNLFDIFSNLTNLQIGATFHEDVFALLINQLNTSLPQLTTLQLALLFNDSHVVFSPNCWRSFSQLQPPALKHLTLCLFGPKFYEKRDITMEPHHLPFLSQLTSFRLFFDEAATFSSVYQLIQQVYGAPNLVPAEKVRFGVSFNYKNDKKLGQEKAELLPYITYLDVNIDFPYEDIIDYTDRKDKEVYAVEIQPLRLLKLHERSMTSLYNILSKMSNLIKLQLTLGIMDNCAEYPGLLAALSNLQHLKTISLDYSKNWAVMYGCYFERSDLCILPAVRTLSIVYKTRVYDDVVKQFHLPYVFPELTDFECTFAQNDSGTFRGDFDYYEEGLGCPERVQVAKIKRAGLKLIRGLVKLPESVKKDIKFEFDWDNYSMEELIALQTEIDIETYDFSWPEYDSENDSEDEIENEDKDENEN